MDICRTIKSQESGKKFNFMWKLDGVVPIANRGCKMLFSKCNCIGYQTKGPDYCFRKLTWGSEGPKGTNLM